MREEVRRAEGDPTMARQDVEKVTRMMAMMKAIMGGERGASCGDSKSN